MAAKKMYSYQFSPLAVSDLNEIFDYLTVELFSPNAAERLIDNIQKAVEGICEFPLSRPLLANSAFGEKGYRLLVVQNFNLFYVVEGQTIIIRRVLHGKRNYEGLL